MSVQCSEVGFRLRFRETGAPSAFVDKGSIVTHTALRSLIQSMQQYNVVGVVCDTTSPVCYSHLFLEIPHFSRWRVRKAFGDFSLETPGSLPSILWVPISTYPSTKVTENVFDFRLGTHYTNSGHCRLAFLQQLGYSPRLYDRYQNAGTRDGHQSRSVPGRLAHLFTISRPMPPRHCTSAQSLPHNGPPHSRQEVGTDPKTEIPFSGMPVRPGFLPGHCNSGSISQNQALISSFLPSQGGCAHTGRSCSVSLRPQKKVFLWDGCTPA